MRRAFLFVLLGSTATVAILSTAAPAQAVGCNALSATTAGGVTAVDGDCVQSGDTIDNSTATGNVPVTITAGSSGSPTVFTNDGTIQSVAGSSQSAIGTKSKDYVTINNSGDIISDATSDSNGSAEAIRLGKHITIDNSGNIRATADPVSSNNAYAIYIGSGDVTNELTGVIENTGNATDLNAGSMDSNVYALYAGKKGTSTITNYGIIRATGNSASVDTGGNEGEVGAVRMGDPGSSGSVLDNYGTIETTGSLVNEGTVDNANIADMYGVRDDGANDIIYNRASASITGGKHGITIDKDASGTTVYNWGTITGENGSGVGSDATDNASVVSVYNYAGATITGTWNQTAYNGGNLAYSFGDGDGVDIDHIAYIENYGTIQGTGAHGIKPGETDPSNSEGLALGGGTVINGDAVTTTALISGAEYGITVNDSNGGDAFGATDITNYGTIRGLNGYAIKLADDAGSWNNTISNYGTISGTSTTTVMLGNGDDTFNDYGGTVTGIVDAEGGSDTLNIDRGAATAYTLVGANWLNFETTNILSGSVTQSGDYSSTTAFNVASGAGFTGTGTVTTTTFTNSGDLSVGTKSATGTLTIDGNFVNEAGSTLAVKLGGSSSDLVDVTGTATLNGGTLESSGIGSLTATTYTVLKATGGVTGTFDTYLDNLSPFARTSLSYDANDVTITVDPVAQTGASSNVANALFNGTGAGPELQQVFTDISGMSAGDAGQALEQLTPDQSNGASNGAVQSANAFAGQTNARVGSLQSAAASARGGHRLALSGDTAGDLAASLVGGSMSSAATAGVWARGFGLTGSLDAQSGATNGLSYKGGGVVAGYDRFISDTTLVGVSVGYARIVNDPDRVGASSDVTTYALGLYAATLLDDVDLSAALGATLNKNHESRHIVILPATDEVASADFDGSTFSANFEAGKTLTYGNVALRPAIGLDWLHVKSDGYTETGAPGLNLSQTSQSDNLLRATVGASVALNGGPVVPSLGLRWGHDISQADGALAYSFAGLGNSSFLIDRNTPDRDALLVDAGLDADLGKGMLLTFAGSADLRSNAQSYGLSVKLGYSW